MDAKDYYKRNDSDELHVFEAASYFSGATENFSGIHKNTKPSRRLSLDMPNHIPLQPMLIEKEFKQPRSPGAKLAHFLNSLFKQTSNKKSKSKKKSTHDEDESSSWRRKRRSSISHFSSGNNNSSATATATITSSAGFRTPPPSIKTTSYSYLKPPPSQINKIPMVENFNKADLFDAKSDLIERNISFGRGFVEKVKVYDEKSREDVKEFRKFNDDDDNDGANSDSSSDLFELTNCEIYSYSSGLPVYETTSMDSIKRGAPVSS